MLFVKGKGALLAYRLRRIMHVLTKAKTHPVYNASRIMPRNNADDREGECCNTVVGPLSPLLANNDLLEDVIEQILVAS